MAYKSNFSQVRRRVLDAEDAGLAAAAQVIRNAVKRGLRGGYTSGDFVTGTNTASVLQTDPFDRLGVRTVLVGTSQTDPPYPLFWEVGHFNVFTGRFERVEVWGPALRDNADAAQRAFARVSGRVFALGFSFDLGGSEAAD